MSLPIENLKNDISKLLSFIPYYVERCNKQNLNNVNTLLEDVFKELLKIVYGYDLKNLNVGTYNYPAVDLGDHTKGVYIQITSKLDKDKVTDALAKIDVNTHPLFGLVKQMKFFEIGRGNKKMLKKNLKTSHKTAYFDPITDLLTIDDLISEINSLGVSKTVDVILEVLTRTISPTMQNEFKSESYEIYIIKELFKAVAQNQFDETLEVRFDDADLLKKKKRFDTMWNYIEQIYSVLYDINKEKNYQFVYNSTDEVGRKYIANYLKVKSIEKLSQVSDPVKAIDALTGEMINDLGLHGFPENEVKYFLYYQLYCCNVFPNPTQ